MHTSVLLLRNCSALYASASIKRSMHSFLLLAIYNKSCLSPNRPFEATLAVGTKTYSKGSGLCASSTHMVIGRQASTGRQPNPLPISLEAVKALDGDNKTIYGFPSRFLWFMQEYRHNFFDKLYYFVHKQRPVK